MAAVRTWRAAVDIRGRWRTVVSGRDMSGNVSQEQERPSDSYSGGRLSGSPAFIFAAKLRDRGTRLMLLEKADDLFVS